MQLPHGLGYPRFLILHLVTFIEYYNTPSDSLAESGPGNIGGGVEARSCGVITTTNALADE